MTKKQDEKPELRRALVDILKRWGFLFHRS